MDASVGELADEQWWSIAFIYIYNGLNDISDILEQDRPPTEYRWQEPPQQAAFPASRSV